VPEKNFIIFSGLDGSGKTTQADKLKDYFQKKNISFKYIWLRYPNFLTLPFAFFVRLSGRSVYLITEQQEKHGLKNLKDKPFLQKFWISIFFNDLKFAIKSKLNSNVDWIIIDRFVIDSIVDLIITTGDNTIISLLTEKFSQLIPKNSKMFYFDISPEISYERNMEESINVLQKRRDVYLTLSKKIPIVIIDSSKSIIDIHKQILKECNLE
jgi:thymidylate kinase